MSLLVSSALTSPSQTIYEPHSFATWAGNSWAGSADGDRTETTFSNPSSVAPDRSGNVYVADTDNHIIRRISREGRVTTFAGLVGAAGSADGIGNQARFDRPHGVATDSDGNVYVVDKYNQTIRKITPEAQVTTFAGAPGEAGSADGAGALARFNHPTAVAVDSSGNVFVTDTINELIRKITPDGVVTTFAGSAGVRGSTDGLGSAARFAYPQGIGTDAAGNVYVCDTANSTVRKITPAGLVSTLAGSPGQRGWTDATGSLARFHFPEGLTADSGGNVYVGDRGNFRLRKVTPAAAVSTLAGYSESGHTDGAGSAARFRSLFGLGVDGDSNVYVADSGNHLIRKCSPAGVVSTYAGVFGNAGGADGVGRAARFYYPRSPVLDAARNLYLADSGGNTIRKIAAGSVVSTLAGAFLQSGSTDAVGTSARFDHPFAVAIDRNGNAYIADTYNQTIRKIAPDGSVSTFAGLTDTFGSADGAGSAARFYYPRGIAVDEAGTIFVADTGNHTIRKITPEGVVSTLAGKTGFPDFADGVGANARFFEPTSLAIDRAGNVLVADRYNSSIRKVTPLGVVSTVTGRGRSGSADGPVATAEFNAPQGVAVDDSDNVYVADTGNLLVRKISPQGSVTTLAGRPGSAGPTDGIGDGVRFIEPTGIAVDPAGVIYVTDYATVRVGRPPPSTPQLITGAGGKIVLTGFANPHSAVEIRATTHPATAYEKIAVVTADAAGKYSFEDAESSTMRRRFYRAAVAIP